MYEERPKKDPILVKIDHQTEYRCPACSKLLGRGHIISGYLETKCLRCGHVISMNVYGATWATL